MAIIQNPFIGGIRKSLGNVSFYKQYGKIIMRAKPLNPKNPKTPAQLKQRSKMRTIIQFVRQVAPLIKLVYADILTDMPRFNKIVGINLKNAFTGNPPVLDHTKVVFCDLIGSTISGVEITAQPNHIMEITWDPNTGHPDEMASLLTFILINCTTNKVLVCRDLVSRNAGSVSITVPSDWAGAMTALHVLTYDYSQIVLDKPQAIIKFQHGCDAGSTVQ
jgi:hypothetical protein